MTAELIVNRLVAVSALVAASFAIACSPQDAEPSAEQAHNSRVTTPGVTAGQADTVEQQGRTGPESRRP
jgi:hypothetical protein